MAILRKRTSEDPIARLTVRERSAWKRAERRTVKDHQAATEAALRALRGSPVLYVVTTDLGTVELVLRDRRIAMVNVVRGGRQALVNAVTRGAHLADAGPAGARLWTLAVDSPALGRVTVLGTAVLVFPAAPTRGGRTARPAA
jgi:hypothetical protein